VKSFRNIQNSTPRQLGTSGLPEPPPELRFAPHSLPLPSALLPARGGDTLKSETPPLARERRGRTCERKRTEVGVNAKRPPGEGDQWAANCTPPELHCSTPSRSREGGFLCRQPLRGSADADVVLVVGELPLNLRRRPAQDLLRVLAPCAARL